MTPKHGHPRRHWWIFTILHAYAPVASNDEEKTRMNVARHVTMEELEVGLDEIRRSPRDEGVLKMIVRRPRSNEREVLEEGELDPGEGLVGDSWKHRASRASDRSPNPDTQ